jgi:hypothetical protein
MVIKYISILIVVLALIFLEELKGLKIGRIASKRYSKPKTVRKFSLKDPKWAGSDSNQRPPPCQGGILTRLDHRPFILIFILTLRPTYIFAD